MSGKVSMEYPHGLDIEWFAIDENDELARFTTGGSGPIPEEHIEAIMNDDLSELVRSLPKVSDAKMMVSMPRPDDFINISQRGLYTFDWADVHRVDGRTQKYELQSKPTTSIKKCDLPIEIRDKNTMVCISVKFSESEVIDVLSYVRCKT